jgi:catechol 2,3-dioxygenase-like lactoylglutathione lyase family enzyme
MRVNRQRRRVPKLIEDMTAILLVSANAKKLAQFYRTALGMPLEDERHDGMPLHYGMDFGNVHFAIHPAGGWTGAQRRNPRSPVIAFRTSNLKAVTERLSASGVRFRGPTDHGFAQVVSFRDPDRHLVEILELRAV